MKHLRNCLLFCILALTSTNSHAQDSSAARKVSIVLVAVPGESFVPLQTALEKAKGISSVTAGKYTGGQASFVLNTVLTTDEIIAVIKAAAPKYYFKPIMQMDQVITMVMSDKPFKENTPAGNQPKGNENSTQNQTLPAATAQTNGQTATHAEVSDYDKVFTKVEIEAEFPGGHPAWLEYLQKNLDGKIPKSKGAPAGTYTVVVQFIVAKDGTVSDVEALTHPGYGMEDEAVRVIKNGPPKWRPGVMNRYDVKSYKKQPVKFIVN